MDGERGATEVEVEKAASDVVVVRNRRRELLSGPSRLYTAASSLVSTALNWRFACPKIFGSKKAQQAKAADGTSQPAWRRSMRVSNYIFSLRGLQQNYAAR